MKHTWIRFCPNKRGLYLLSIFFLENRKVLQNFGSDRQARIRIHSSEYPPMAAYIGPHAHANLVISPWIYGPTTFYSQEQKHISHYFSVVLCVLLNFDLSNSLSLCSNQREQFKEKIQKNSYGTEIKDPRPNYSIQERNMHLIYLKRYPKRTCIQNYFLS